MTLLAKFSFVAIQEALDRFFEGIRGRRRAARGALPLSTVLVGECLHFLNTIIVMYMWSL